MKKKNQRRSLRRVRSMKIAIKEFLMLALHLKYFVLLFVINYCSFHKSLTFLFQNYFHWRMDIFGLPYSDDDEEEYRPPMEENDTEKENDNYVRIYENFLKFRF